MTIRVEAWVLRQRMKKARDKVTEGLFTFVAIDDEGNKRTLPTEP